MFKIEKDGTGFASLHDFFGADPANGDSPEARLVEASDGALYATTSYGGAHDSGIVFKVGKDGTSFLKLHDFDRLDPANGNNPWDGLVQGSDGALYGNAGGGAYASGIVYRLNQDGTGFLKLHDFSPTDGASPDAGLLEGSDGLLYGTTTEGGSYNWGVTFKLGQDGGGFLRLHEFSPSVGAFLYSTLLQGSDGALYGTTYRGGAHGSGMIFKLTSASVGFPFHTFQTLHDFDFNDPANGSYPWAGLIEGSDGALYGTASEGGAAKVGVVFRIGKDGSGFQKVHDFVVAAGGTPLAPVMEGSDGALYGTTSSGGGVFKVNKDGSGFQMLHAFGGHEGPAGLVEASDGMLYGTTPDGGVYDDGIVFRLRKDGTGVLKLHDFNFADKANGARPYGGVIQASDGALYGTTRTGGAAAGIIFKIDKNGFQKVHDFRGADGATPMAGVIEGPDGALYGTTYSGGPRYYGTVFKVSKDGTGFLTLHGFGRSDGLGPSAALVQGPRGALYGTTYGGGPGGGGVVFSLVMPPTNGNANRVPSTATTPPRP